MTETTNLHLPQFAESDRIHHDDFNDAFSKLDTAVKANSTAIADKADAADLTAETTARQSADTALQTAINACSRFVKLRDITLSQNRTELSVDVSDIDWSAWQRIHLDINMNIGSQGYLYANSAADANKIATLSGVWSADFDRPLSRITLCPGGWADRLIVGSMGGGSVSSIVRYRDLSAFVLAGTTFMAGGRFVLWGEA